MSGTPRLGGVLEAAIYARDLDAAEAFFGGLLGLERIQRVGTRHVFFRVGGTVLLVFNPEQTTRPPRSDRLPVPPHGAEGPGHVCLSAADDDLELWQAQLTDRGVAIEADFRWPNGARSIYLRDPAGNSIELADRRLWFDDDGDDGAG